MTKGAMTSAAINDARKPRIGFFVRRAKKPKLSVMKKKILMERLQVCSFSLLPLNSPYIAPV